MKLSAGLGLCSLLALCATSASAQSDINSITDMVGLTDQQLSAIYANPADGNPAIPGITSPNSFTFCSGLTYINFFTNGTNSFLKGPLPGGATNPLNQFAGAIWIGKIFETNSQGQTALWNVLFNNSTVAVTALVDISPVGLRGSQVPSIEMDYSIAELVPARVFHGEMRLVGPNIYLGIQYLTDPAIAYQHIAQTSLDAATQAAVANVTSQVINFALSHPGLSFPIPLTYFGLQCGQPVPHFTQLSISTLAASLDSFYHYWPVGYQVPAPITPANG